MGRCPPPRKKKRNKERKAWAGGQAGQDPKTGPDHPATTHDRHGHNDTKKANQGQGQDFYPSVFDSSILSGTSLDAFHDLVAVLVVLPPFPAQMVKGRKKNTLAVLPLLCVRFAVLTACGGERRTRYQDPLLRLGISCPRTFVFRTLLTRGPPDQLTILIGRTRWRHAAGKSSRPKGTIQGIH